MSLPDDQALRDTRDVDLEPVGVEGLRYPVLVCDRRGDKREMVVTITTSVDVVRDVKSAHLSRFVEVLHDWRDQVWFDELIDVAERSASSPLYPVLKRPDERHVTMSAYDNPVFVEDMARSVVVALRADRRVARRRVRVANDESIHNHAAFAQTSWVADGDEVSDA